MAANAKSRAVDGVMLPDGGCKYKLEDGTEYALQLADFRSVPNGSVRWLHG